MIYLFYALHIIVCVFLILVVLLQQGKGADLSVFGGGSTQTAFGARGAATLLHKLTVACFVLFIFTTLGIAVLKGGGASATVMSEVEADQAAASEEQAQPADDEAAPEAMDSAPAEAGGETAAEAPPMEAAEGAADEAPLEGAGTDAGDGGDDG